MNWIRGANSKTFNPNKKAKIKSGQTLILDQVIN